MKQALIVVDEIKRLEESIAKSKSRYLTNDCSKNIYELKKELKEYCGYRGYDYEKLVERYKI